MKKGACSPAMQGRPCIRDRRSPDRGDPSTDGAVGRRSTCLRRQRRQQRVARRRRMDHRPARRWPAAGAVGEPVSAIKEWRQQPVRRRRRAIVSSSASRRCGDAGLRRGDPVLDFGADQRRRAGRQQVRERRRGAHVTGMSGATAPSLSKGVEAHARSCTSIARVRIPFTAVSPVCAPQFVSAGLRCTALWPTTAEVDARQGIRLGGDRLYRAQEMSAKRAARRSAILKAAGGAAVALWIALPR